MEYKIRKAIIEDLDSIFLIHQQFKLDFCKELPCIKKYFIEENILKNEMFVLEEKEIIACSHIETNYRYVIDSIAVKKEYHKKGYGKILINFLIDEWLKTNYNVIEVGTFECYNVLNFYLKFGFKIKNIFNDFYNDNKQHRVFILYKDRRE